MATLTMASLTALGSRTGNTDSGPMGKGEYARFY